MQVVDGPIVVNLQFGAFFPLFLEERGKQEEHL